MVENGKRAPAVQLSKPVRPIRRRLEKNKKTKKRTRCRLGMHAQLHAIVESNIVQYSIASRKTVGVCVPDL